MASHFALVRMGLWTFPISGMLFVIGYILNGALPDPATGPTAIMSAFATPRFALGAFVNLVGMLLNPFGFLALYVHIATHGPTRTGLLGMITSIPAIGLTLAGYGVILFDLPYLGQQFILGKIPAEVGYAVATNPTFVSVLVFACFMYFVGAFFYAIALWCSRLCPPTISIGFALSAFFLGFGPLLPMPAVWGGILGGALLATTGGWLVWHAENDADVAA